MAVAAQYTGKGVGRFASKVTNKLKKAERQVLGPAGVKFFRGQADVLGSVLGEETIKQGSEEMADAYRLANEVRLQSMQKK